VLSQEEYKNFTPHLKKRPHVLIWEQKNE
jgi:hypothetical protein